MSAMIGAAGGVAAFVALVALRGKFRRRVVAKGLEAASRALVGRRAPELDLHMSSISWYGAVDTNARHLAVWILVEGADSRRIPPRFSYQPGELERLPGPVAAWLGELRDEVIARLGSAGWYRRPPFIGVESRERVDGGGGVEYFR